eukprot:5524767-Karenia_brevis.AAC.1
MELWQKAIDGLQQQMSDCKAAMTKEEATLDEEIMEAEKQADYIKKEFDALQHNSVSVSSSAATDPATTPTAQPTSAHGITPDMVQIMATQMTQA